MSAIETLKLSTDVELQSTLCPYYRHHFVYLDYPVRLINSVHGLSGPIEALPAFSTHLGITIPQMPELAARVAHAIVALPYHLTGGELLFLKRVMDKGNRPLFELSFDQNLCERNAAFRNPLNTNEERLFRLQVNEFLEQQYAYLEKQTNKLLMLRINDRPKQSRPLVLAMYGLPLDASDLQKKWEIIFTIDPDPILPEAPVADADAADTGPADTTDRKASASRRPRSSPTKSSTRKRSATRRA